MSANFTVSDGISIVQAVANLVPVLFSILSRMLGGDISVEQAETEARAEFSKTVALLIDPKKDAAATNAAVDAEADKKFPPPQ